MGWVAGMVEEDFLVEFWDKYWNTNSRINIRKTNNDPADLLPS